MRDWREEQHPRDKRGRFRDKGTGWAGQVSAAIGGMPATRDLVADRDSWNWRAARQRVTDRARAEDYSHADHSLAHIYEQQGFHARPTVVEQEEFDRMAQAGEIVPLYRGLIDSGPEAGSVPAAELAERFRTGDQHYAGYGVFGNGTYVTPQHYTAQYSYTSQHLGGSVLRMALRPGARIVDIDELRRQYKADTQWGFYDRLSDQVLDGEITRDEADALRQDYERSRSVQWESLIEDLGRYAAAKGYDAVGASYDALAEEYREIVILNRGAVIADASPARMSVSDESEALGRGVRKASKQAYGIT